MSDRDPPPKTFDDIVQFFGGSVVSLARALGMSRQYAYELRATGKFPPGRAYQIESKSFGNIKASQVPTEWQQGWN